MTRVRCLLPVLLCGLLSDAAFPCQLPSDLERVPDLPSFGRLELEPELCNRLGNTLLTAEHRLGIAETDSQRAKVMGDLARRLYGFGFVPQARALFEIARALSPDDYVLAWMLSVIEHENGGPRTMELAEAALELNPDHLPIQALMARLRLESGNREEARELARRVVANSPESAYARWTLSEIALLNGEAEEALLHLSLALEAEPDADLLQSLRAEALRQLSRDSEAQLAQELAGDREPPLTGPWISTLTKVPFTPLSDLRFGTAALRRRQYTVALAALERAHASDPSDSEAARLLGVCQRSMGQRDAALRSFRMATQLEGRYENWIELARTLQEAGDFDGAAATYRNALELRPGDKMARFWLAECLTQLGELDSALVLVEQLLGEGFGAQGYILASAIESRQGRQRRARDLLLLGLRRFPENAKLQAALEGLEGPS